MSRRILKSRRARRDLLDHFTFIGQDNLTAAERFLDAAESDFVKLAQHPGMGRLWQSPSPRLKDMRVWPVQDFRKYLVFYRPVEGGVEIIHVLHGAREIERILDAENPEA